MRNRIFAIAAACAMALSLTACSRGDDSSNTEQQRTVEAQMTAEAEPAADETQEYRRPIDLNAVYDAIMAEQPAELEPLVLLPETNTELIYSVYPNLENVDTNQMVYYCPAVMGYPCEIMMIETKTQREADYAYDVFLDRIDNGAADTAHPENADGWTNRAEVHQDGVYVAMIVLPDGYEIPSNVFYLVD